MNSLLLRVVLGMLALTVGGMALAGNPTPSGETPRRLAVLIAACEPGEWSGAPLNDLNAMYQALRNKGYRPEEIVTLSGYLHRHELMKALRDVAGRVAGWRDGSVFLYYSGSGHVDPQGALEPGVHLGKGPGDVVLWREIFQTLQLPSGVHLTLLPDCCHSNCLLGQLPANVTAIVLDAPPSALQCQAKNTVATINGKRVQHGVISYYAALALPEAQTVGQWLERMNTLCDRDVRGQQLHPALRLAMTVAGNPGQALFGQ